VLLLRQLKPRCLWLPSYLCPSLLAAAAHAETRIEFYDVGDQLIGPHTLALNQVEEGDGVLLIEYFGMPVDPGAVEHVRSRQAWSLLDASQSLLSAYDRIADFILFSCHKFVGVPDGGVLAALGLRSLASPQLSAPPADWWNIAWKARFLRRAFDMGGTDRSWFDLFQQGEANGPLEPHAMSSVSRELLVGSFDYPEIARRRRSNYKCLAARLPELALFPSLPSGTCPIGFPLRLSRRDEVRNRLFEKQIFAPVHWSLEGSVPEQFAASHALSAEVMTLPCDQRYSEADMEWMADCVLAASR
jgi:dTDP-4-amino-4,6-dideoxygalactose transaminase